MLTVLIIGLYYFNLQTISFCIGDELTINLRWPLCAFSE